MNKPATTKAPTCPVCNRKMHTVCGNKECVCFKRIPEGELPMPWRFMLGDAEISHLAFDVLWHMKQGWRRDSGIELYELEVCPYCGYADLPDYWADREIEQVYPNGFHARE